MRFCWLLKEVFYFGIRLSGIPLIVRHAVARTRVSIMLYHYPRPEVLEKHLAYLSRHYNFVTIEQLSHALSQRKWGEVPPRALLITIDDGRYCNALLGGVFKRYNVRPIIYLCTRIVASHRAFWWFQVPNRRASELKQLPHFDRLVALERDTGYTPDRDYCEKRPDGLSKDEITAMAEWADFGSHTRYHPILTTCDGKTCADEIIIAKAELERLTGKPCRHFAYPNGDYSERELELVRRAGYTTARAVDVGWTSVRSDPFRLRVTRASDDASVNALIAQVCGLPQWLRLVVRGRFNGRKPSIRI